MPNQYENYQILGLNPGASAEEARKAYYKLALKTHPDKGGNEEDFKRIDNAYKALIKLEGKNEIEREEWRNREEELWKEWESKWEKIDEEFERKWEKEFEEMRKKQDERMAKIQAEIVEEKLNRERKRKKREEKERKEKEQEKELKEEQERKKVYENISSFMKQKATSLSDRYFDTPLKENLQKKWEEIKTCELSELEKLEEEIKEAIKKGIEIKKTEKEKEKKKTKLKQIEDKINRFKKKNSRYPKTYEALFSKCWEIKNNESELQEIKFSELEGLEKEIIEGIKKVMEKRKDEETETNKTINNMTGIKNIILFGEMQSGKSALANVLTNSNEFVEKNYDENRGIKFLEFELGEENYRAIKTVAGLGQIGMDTRIILSKLNEVVSLIEKDGLNQIFFVARSDEPFDRETVETYDLLASVIFAPEVLDYITIVLTYFPNFEIEDMCQESLEEYLNKSEDLKRIFSRKKVIFLNNPPTRGRSAELNKQIRKDSREILIAHLNSIAH